MRVPLLIVAFVGCLYGTSAYAASKDTILHTSYARASTYRSADTDTTSGKETADATADCTGRDCTKSIGGNTTKSSRRGGRDNDERPRWHSMLPGMIR